MEIATDKGIDKRAVLVAVGLITAVAASFAGFVSIIIFVIVPAVNGHRAAAAHHNAQQLVAIHRHGFTQVQQADMQNDGWSNYFDYSVGSCTTSVYVERPYGQYRVYRTYVWLKTAQGTRVYVTLHSLTNLPQMAGCLVK